MIKFKWGGLFGIQPHSALFRFPHLFSFAGSQKSEGHAINLLPFFSSEQLHAADDITPLVIAAQFQNTSIAMVQLQEVIALHQHIVEFNEGKAPLHPLLIAFCGQHPIYSEMNADIANEFNIIQIQKPVSIISHDSFSIGKIDQARHLFLEAAHIVVDDFFCHHLAHVTFARGIPYHSCSASEESDRDMSGPLHMSHNHNLHEMPYMKAVCRGVKPDIKFHGFLSIEQPCSNCRGRKNRGTTSVHLSLTAEASWVHKYTPAL